MPKNYNLVYLDSLDQVGYQTSPVEDTAFSRCVALWTCSATVTEKRRSHEPKLGTNKQLLVTHYFEALQGK